MKPERLAREVVYQSRWVNLYKDTVRFPNGFVIDKYHLLDFEREAVVALMENKAGDVIFALIPRYASNTVEWELPAGGMEASLKLPSASYWKKLVIVPPTIS
jgi:ADP-ribose pyrophosphatase